MIWLMIAGVPRLSGACLFRLQPFPLLVSATSLTESVHRDGKSSDDA